MSYGQGAYTRRMPMSFLLYLLDKYRFFDFDLNAVKYCLGDKPVPNIKITL